mmetsp:Transcript_82621/g.96616  ORF Transcript_82621/g.96616 Transcript_82621/m.96616 type:complete len:420 (+) Transcript_82621:26-1285(+)
MSSSKNTEEKPLRIAFIHPDLGIGGAEQLVVNFALALQNKGHYVKIYTPFHDPKHCFKETIDGTLNVEVRGSIFPREIFKKFTAFCAIVRMILATLHVCLFGGKYDIVIVDQVSASIPILRLFRKRVLFYCHFPDKLLCVERRSIFKKFYRFFLDFFEEVTTGFAHLILVNSHFTQGIFYKSFKLLNKIKKRTDVLYPAIDLSKFDKAQVDVEIAKKFAPETYFFSLNRYERKKNINLALKAYAKFKELKKNTNLKLVICGGYDHRVRENVEHLEELRALAKSLNIEEDKEIFFLCSVSDSARATLLRNSFCVLYTPENEHFGIVPTEAMYTERPIIACNSGGPKESVLEGKTGYLIETDESKWAEKMAYLADHSDLANGMGKQGKVNVVNRFGLEAFAESANNHVWSVVAPKRKTKAT